MPNPSDADTARQAALAELASLTSIEFGTLAEIRPGSSGFKHQCWEDGRNRSTYIPAAQVAALREDLENGRRFQQITAELAQAAIRESRARRAATAADPIEKKTSKPTASRKNTAKRSDTSPKRAKSSPGKKRARP